MFLQLFSAWVTTRMQNMVSVQGQRSRSAFLDFVTSFIGSTWAGGARQDGVGQGMERLGNRTESHALKVMDRKSCHDFQCVTFSAWLSVKGCPLSPSAELPCHCAKCQVPRHQRIRPTQHTQQKEHTHTHTHKHTSPRLVLYATVLVRAHCLSLKFVVVVVSRPFSHPCAAVLKR
jgi:hypothetical protein